MKFAFITDSSNMANANELIKQDIYSLALQVIVDGKAYKENIEINNQKVCDFLAQDANLSTSLPSLAEIEDTLNLIKNKNYDKVIVLTMAANLSGTLNAIITTAQRLDLDLEIVESFTASYLELDLVNYFRKIYQQTNDFNQSINQLKEYILKTDTLIVVENFKNLAKSGRMSKTASSIAGLLQIKALLHLNYQSEGRIEVLDKTRTYKKLFNLILQRIQTFNFTKAKIYICNVSALDKAEELKEFLASNLIQAKIIISDLTAAVSVHTGLNSMAIQIMEDYE